MRVETEGHIEVRAAPPEGGADLTPSHLGQEMPHHSIFLNQINTHFPTQKSAKKYYSGMLQGASPSVGGTRIKNRGRGLALIP